jgi:Flp pilus assembly pilin Flp
VTRSLVDGHGQGIVEYGLILALTVIFVILVLAFMSGTVSAVLAWLAGLIG